jgi:hypothetical protein
VGNHVQDVHPYFDAGLMHALTVLVQEGGHCWAQGRVIAGLSGGCVGLTALGTRWGIDGHGVCA